VAILADGNANMGLHAVDGAAVQFFAFLARETGAPNIPLDFDVGVTSIH
jgi:hypothetical protein